jgi:quercetin dioxygenase-like cupin family protein
MTRRRVAGQCVWLGHRCLLSHTSERHVLTIEGEFTQFVPPLYSRMRIPAAVLLAALAILPARTHGAAQTPAPAAPTAAPATPVGMTRTPVIDNAAVTVTRIRFAPGTREEPHTHPFTLVIAQLTRGDLEFLQDTTTTHAIATPGQVELVPSGVTHAGANPSQQGWDVMAIAVKGHGPVPPGDSTESPSTTPLADQTDARAMLTLYTPAPSADGHQRIETFNTVIIPLATARIEVRIGGDTTQGLFQPGDAIFLPKGIVHAVRDAGTAPFTAVVVAVP